jgi:hypothetical protein
VQVAQGFEQGSDSVVVVVGVTGVVDVLQMV